MNWKRLEMTPIIVQGLTKRRQIFHDKVILRKSFIPGQKVLQYNSKLYLPSKKLRSIWIGCFIVGKLFSHIVVEIEDPKCCYIFKVNGQRFKLFMEFQANNKEEAMVVHEPQYLEFGKKLYILYSIYYQVIYFIQLLLSFLEKKILNSFRFKYVEDQFFFRIGFFL